MENNRKNSLVFITGTFLGNNCWDEWKRYFEAKGYQCTAPAWPHKDASPEILRNRHPDPGIASINLIDLTDYFASIISALPQRPILIGHSIGGLIVQLLLQRDLGAAGVAIRSFPPGGMGMETISFLKTMWGPMGLFSSSAKTYMIPFTKWKREVTNGMTCEEQKELFYEFATPESKHIVRDSFKAIAKVKFEKKRPPLLLISGSRDHIVSPSLNFRNYEGYLTSSSITDYKNFNGRNHLIFGRKEWKDEADFIFHWLEDLKLVP